MGGNNSCHGFRRSFRLCVGPCEFLPTAQEFSAVDHPRRIGLPWANASYVDANYDWGYTTCPTNDPNCFALSGIGPGNVRYGEADPWRYYLRNCTSFVAWKLTSLGGPASKVEDLGNGRVVRQCARKGPESRPDS